MKAARTAYDQCLDAHASAIAAQNLPRDQAISILMAECRDQGEAYADAVDDLNDARRNDTISRQNALGGAALLHQMGQDARGGQAPSQRINVTVTPWNGRGPPPPP